jgi:hypothetical protein
MDSTTADLLSVPKGDISELVREVRSLTKSLQVRSSRKPRFPFPCKNGSMCPYRACNNCWFVHELDEVPIVKGSSTHEGKHTNEDKLKQGESKLADMCSKLEKKLGELSSYIDRRLGSIECKVEALADASLDIESQVKELCDEAHQSHAENIDEKLDLCMKIVGDRCDKQIDDKVSEFMKTSVKDAFEAAMNAFAGHVAARIDKIEGKLGIVEDSNDSSLADKT